MSFSMFGSHINIMFLFVRLSCITVWLRTHVKQAGHAKLLNYDELEWSEVEWSR